MKKVIKNYGGIILFYIVIIFGVFYLNDTNKTLNYKALTKDNIINTNN